MARLAYDRLGMLRDTVGKVWRRSGREAKLLAQQFADTLKDELVANSPVFQYDRNRFYSPQYPRGVSIAESWLVQLYQTTYGISVNVVSDARHLDYVRFGTPSHMIPARRSPVLSFWWGAPLRWTPLRLGHGKAKRVQSWAERELGGAVYTVPISIITAVGTGIREQRAGPRAFMWVEHPGIQLDRPMYTATGQKVRRSAETSDFVRYSIMRATVSWITEKKRGHPYTWPPRVLEPLAQYFQRHGKVYSREIYQAQRSLTQAFLRAQIKVE